MKKSIFLSFLLLTLFSFTIVSCKSAPKTEPAQSPGPAPELPPEPPPANINFSGKADQARKRAMDFDSQHYFPSDWDAVEGQYANAANLPSSDNRETNDKLDAFNAVADSYDALFNKTIPLYAQAREDEIMEVRNNITDLVDINDFYEYIKPADDIALTALSQYEDGDYYKAKDSAGEALYEYNLLLLGANVYIARLEIFDRGFEGYDPDNLAATDDLALQALKDYNDDKKEAAKAKASDAELRYNLILKNCWIRYASDRKKSAADEKDRAIANKVNVAVRESFRDADVIFAQAEDEYKDENYEDAALMYTEAEARFAVAGRETENKRQRAEDAIRIAEKEITANEETAIRVDSYLDGGSR